MNRSPVQNITPKPYKFTPEETQLIQAELNKFLNTNIIEEVINEPEQGEFISNIFYRPKPNNKIRIILNLKPFNEEYIDKIHFKMETLSTATSAMRQNCWFASVDLADAYYSIPVCENDRKFLRFFFQGKKYQFCALVMGLASSPRVFSKLLKPVFAHLRSHGHVSAAYIDDSCLQGNTKEECAKNVTDTITLFDSLGLTINLEKSVLEPCQNLIFLGFFLCSLTMTVRLTDSRKEEILQLCLNIINLKRTTIKDFAQLIGKLVAAIPGVEHALLYIKPLEKVKDKQLGIHQGNYKSFMTIPTSIKPNIQWWIDNVKTSYKKISYGPPDLVLYSDSSKQGWGGYNETDNQKTGGLWDNKEQEEHINILELKACELTIKAFCKNMTGKHIKVFMDNTNSVAYLKNYGGRTDVLNDIARNIWLWCIEQNLVLTVAHVPGVENTCADALSRLKNDDTEWSLSDAMFKTIYNKYPEMCIDLFASRLNHKLAKYVSRYPDHKAYKIDAFSFPWISHLMYIYPPFSIISNILQKIVEDNAEAVLVCPIWPTQPWWPSLLQLICDKCYLLPHPREILSLHNNPTAVHPLQKMKLGLFRLSGNVSKSKKFQKTQETLSSIPGGNQQKDNIMYILENGLITVDDRLIPLIPI